jgi:hypothetical protein
MTVPTRPAAYICGAQGGDEQTLARLAQAAAERASERGWPEPAVYADAGQDLADAPAPGLASLSAAISAGRHDAVLITGPSLAMPGPEYLMEFLFRCTRQGVLVDFLSCPAPPPQQASSQQPLSRSAQPTSAPPTSAPPTSALAPSALARPASPPSAATEHLPPFPLPCSIRGVLTRASLEALSELFPDWLIWCDEHGWHGRRRVDEYRQRYRSGAPAFCVHAPSPLDLAAQLRWQQAADAHAPYGCSVG